jgi:hypothetical protein
VQDDKILSVGLSKAMQIAGRQGRALFSTPMREKYNRHWAGKGRGQRDSCPLGRGQLHIRQSNVAEVSQ